MNFITRPDSKAWSSSDWMSRDHRRWGGSVSWTSSCFRSGLPLVGPGWSYSSIATATTTHSRKR